MVCTCSGMTPAHGHGLQQYVTADSSRMDEESEDLQFLLVFFTEAAEIAEYAPARQGVSQPQAQRYGRSVDEKHDM